MKPADLVRVVLRYVGSSWARASILGVLGTWAVLLTVAYQHQAELLRAVGLS